MMDAKRSRKAALVWIIALAALLSINLLIPVASVTTNSEHQKKGEVRCIETERKALLKFMKGLTQDDGLSEWWVTEECCNWYGVTCSDTTDHVNALELPSFSIAGEISPALLELTHLRRLDLSSNQFMGSRIPKFIGSMKKLEYLSLRNSNFSGMIPPQLGNLTNLHTLDLSDNSFTIIPEFIGSMKQLEYLDLRNSNFSGMIPPQLRNLTNLRKLDLSHNFLWSGNLSWLSSLSHLSELYLSNNSFTRSRIPDFIGSMKQLEYLELSNSNFSGMIPPQLGNLTNLIYLDLSDNFLWSENLNWLSSLSHLSGLALSSSNISDPNWIQPIMMLPSLQYLNLRSCNLTDVVPSPGLFANSSSTSLYGLDLAHNNLTSSVFDWLFNISTSLVTLDLSYNKLAGPIPDSFGGLVNLEELDLSANKLQGSLPSCLGQLSNLRTLYVSFNSLEGAIYESHFTQFRSLQELDLSFNSLTIQIAPHWIPPFQLYVLGLARCNMGHHFPNWIQTQSQLQVLDVSDAGLSCKVPQWLWSFSPDLVFLNISFNHINGTIPHLSSTSLQAIDVRSNKFSGPIPLFSPVITIIMLSQNMFSGPISSICTSMLSQISILDLSNNVLVGELPDCWENMTAILYLNLANNTFSGDIPHSLGTLSHLSALHLHGNNLSGQIPPSFLSNCQALQLIDIGGNKLTGDISWLAANYPYLNYLMLGDNRFHGSIPPQICHSTRLQILDLSRNNLSGKIPDCFNNLTSICGNYTHDPFVGVSYGDITNHGQSFAYERIIVQWKGQVAEYTKILGLLKLIDLSSNRLVGTIPTSFSDLKGLISLNLSRNNFTGNIIPGIGEMEALETLDLSRNQLSSEIPIGMAQLHFLSFLDLANNNLSGQIPSSTQLQSFNASSYAGNVGLCGPPLLRCPNTSNSTEPEDDSDEKGSSFLSLSSQQELFASVFMGFFIGFWGVVASLVLKQSWRSAYYNTLSVVGDWFLVNTALFLAKFRRR